MKTTDHISMDEPCLFYAEVNAMAEDKSGQRRFRTYIVIRDDEEAKYVEDLGPAWAFTADQFTAPGGAEADDGKSVWIEETVGSLTEAGEKYRATATPIAQIRGPSDLIGGYREWQERSRRQLMKDSALQRKLG